MKNVNLHVSDELRVVSNKLGFGVGFFVLVCLFPVAILYLEHFKPC